MSVGIFSGVEGVGKTSQLLTLAKAYPKAYWIVMELKDKDRLKKEADEDLEVCIAYTTHPKGHKTQKKVDPVATLKAIEAARDHMIDMEPQTCIVDGISDLRKYATSVWALDYNEKNNTHLTQPKYKDWGEWGLVNEMVQDILEPMINTALDGHLDLWMTSQMKPDYKNDIKIGDKPDLKDWMSYPVQCLFLLERTKSEYSLQCTKEPENAAWEVPELQKEVGILKALVEHGLVDRSKSVIEQIAEQKTYMVRYGNHEKMFIVAASKAKAGIKFEAETDGKIETYEVLE
jgi:hypothetical protein